MKRWTEHALTVLVMTVALGIGFIGHRACTAAPSGPQQAGAPATLPATLPDSRGKLRRLSEWEGKVRVINFWATWCPPCRDEMPLLVRSQARWAPRGVQFIGIALDNAADVDKFGRELKVNYPLLIAEEQGATLMQRLGNTAGVVPYTLVLDGKGRVLQRHAGEVHAADLEAWLTAATARR